jgi:muscleblind protein
MANMNVPHHMKDSRWLQLEVCREAQRNKCSRSDEECKFAHPPAHVEIQNGRVVACYDSIKGRCNRENPPCKYYHPPQHLKDQLLINGRNHLAMKNILVQQMQMQAVTLQPQLQMQPQLSLMTPYYNPAAFSTGSPYLSTTPTYLTSAPSPGPSGSGMSNHGDAGTSTSISPLTTATLLQHQMQQQQQQQQQHAGNKNRMDRLEVCREFSRGSCRRTELECRYAHPAEHVQVTDNMVVVCMDSLKGKCGRETCRYFHPPAHLVQQLKSRQSVNTSASGSSAAAGVANAAVGVNVYSCPSSASVSLPTASQSDLGQQLQAALAAQNSPFLAAAAMLNQKQAMAAMLAAHAAAAQQAQAAAAAATSVYAHSHSSALNNAVNQAAMQAANVSPSLTLALSDFLSSMGQKNLKRKASYEQDSDLVFHGLAASVKRQTMSPSSLSGPSLALFHQHQQQQQHQQTLQAMYSMAPLLSSFQHSLSMQQHYPSINPGLLSGQSSSVNPGGLVTEQQLHDPEENDPTVENPPASSS